MSEPDSHSHSSYFIADLHLDPDRPCALQFALTFFEQVRNAQALYILGDLFEYWIGDDAGISQYPDVIEALAAVSASGCELTVMLGNRDFLLGEQFAEAVGARLVREDEILINVQDKPVLLMHGDTLCIDDIEYQQFRKQVRDSGWQGAFLSKTIGERLAYAAHLREQSRESTSGKSAELMDVNARQVQTTMARRDSNVLIHGHTHRPNIHIDATEGTRRLVLGDWHDEHASYVVIDAEGFHLKNFCGLLGTCDG